MAEIQAIQSPILAEMAKNQKDIQTLSNPVNSNIETKSDTFEKQEQTQNEPKTFFEKAKKWLNEPIENPNYNPYAAPVGKNSPTTTRLKSVKSFALIVGIFVGYLLFVEGLTKRMTKSMSSESVVNRAREIWQNLGDSPKIEDLALPCELKKTAERLIKKFQNPEALIQKGNTDKKSILLYGPPGTGKTTFAKAIAQAFPNARFRLIDLSSMQSKYIGDTENMLHSQINSICKYAQEHPGERVFVFFDEIDTLATQNNGFGNQQYQASTLNALKLCIEEKLNKCKNIVTIAATNVDIDDDSAGQKLSSAIISRFGEKVRVNNPTSGQFAKAIANHYKGLNNVAEYLKDENSPEVQQIASTLAQKGASFRGLNTLFDFASSQGEVSEKLTIKDIMGVISEIKSDEASMTSRKPILGFQNSFN